MAKILKNTTGSTVAVSDTGVTLPASPTAYTIPPQDFPLWASSANIVNLINAGTVIVNDGYGDLSKDLSIKHLQEESIPRATSLITTTNVQATANSTLTLTVSSSLSQIFTGTTAGQILKLPDATTLVNGYKYDVWNLSTQNVVVNNNGNSALATFSSNTKCSIILQSNGTSNGTWVFESALVVGNTETKARFLASSGFDGNASTGRYLEFNSNVDSNVTGFILPRNAVLKEISYGQQVNAAVTWEVRRQTPTPITTLATVTLISSERKKTITGLNINIAAGEELSVYCTAGACARPIMYLFFIFT
jgi:hypothetical protein